MPATNDPNKKLNQAAHLFSEGRSLAALKLIKEAQEIFQKENNVPGLIKTNLALADVYKTSINEKHNLPDLAKAAQSYEKAADLYNSQKFYHHETLYLMFAGVLHGYSGDNIMACSTLNEAMKAFKLDSIDKEKLDNSKDLPLRIKEELKKNNC